MSSSDATGTESHPFLGHGQEEFPTQPEQVEMHYSELERYYHGQAMPLSQHSDVLPTKEEGPSAGSASSRPQEPGQNQDENDEAMNEFLARNTIREGGNKQASSSTRGFPQSNPESEWERKFLLSLNSENPNFTDDSEDIYRQEAATADGSSQGQTAPPQNIDERQETLESRSSQKSEDSEYPQRHTTEAPLSFTDPHVSQFQRQTKLRQEEPDFSQQKPLYFKDVRNLRTAKDGICSNVHILGTGNIGKFIAHSLAGMVGGPKVTLLLHRPLRIQDWYDEGQAITLYTKQEPSIRTGFAVESSTSIEFHPDESYPAFGPNLETSIVPPTSIIDHLIVTAKATKIVSALESVKSRLRPTSTVCIIHNGMGVMDQITEELFPNPVTRPNIVIGTISHGVGSVAERKFSCSYNGNGVLDICHLDRYYNDKVYPQFRLCSREMLVLRKNVGYPPSTRYLMRTLTRCLELKATGHSYNKFLLIQLEKLAINAVINPLTVIYDCKNSELLHNEPIKSTMRSLLREISAVILALPELASEKMLISTTRDALERRFDPERLYTLVIGVAAKTGWNFSSTLQDVKKGEKTEIGFINGYVTTRGMEVGVRTPVNEFVVEAVRGKERNVRRVRDGFIPLRFRKPRG